jgi:hypothetical protein
MAVRMKTTSPGTRLQVGASVLAAARGVDTRLVDDRLKRFEQAHRAYANAQRKVDAAESALGVAQARLAQEDAVQDEAVNTLACVLIGERKLRGNPFDTFGAPAPGTLMRLPFAEEAAAVHQLIAAVLRSKDGSQATTAAAKAADEATFAVEQAIDPIAKLQDAVRDARGTRDAVGQAWESALAALQRVARAAAKEGAPELFATLFAPLARAASKTKPAAEPAETAPQTPPTTSNAA